MRSGNCPTTMRRHGQWCLGGSIFNPKIQQLAWVVKSGANKIVVPDKWDRDMTPKNQANACNRILICTYTSWPSLHGNHISLFAFLHTYLTVLKAKEDSILTIDNDMKLNGNQDYPYWLLKCLINIILFLFIFLILVMVDWLTNWLNQLLAVGWQKVQKVIVGSHRWRVW